MGKMVLNHQIFWGGNVNILEIRLFFRKFMKVSQDAKKWRKNTSEFYQNVFDDGQGT